MEPYNGYTGRERDTKYQEFKRLKALGLGPSQSGPCQLCGDPSVPVDPHSEDYSLPYLWLAPAEYMVCRSCHGWIHKRFGRPEAWSHFKSHVRRGGYAKEFAGPAVKKERDACSAAIANGIDFYWAVIEGRDARTGMDWWEHLTILPASLTSILARPRR
jgi:hypothetical protein